MVIVVTHVFVVEISPGTFGDILFLLSWRCNGIADSVTGGVLAHRCRARQIKGLAEPTPSGCRAVESLGVAFPAACGVIAVDDSVTKLVTIIKSLTAREIFRRCPGVKKKLWGGEFWSDGYFASTVGRQGIEWTIGACVKQQGCSYQKLHEDRQLALF